MQYTKICAGKKPPKTIYQFMLNCAEAIWSDTFCIVSFRIVSPTGRALRSSEEAYTLVDSGLPDWQITKFICFLIQNIYCQTAHKSRGVAPKRAPKCLVLPGFLGSSVLRFRKGSPEDAALKLPEKWEEDIKIHQMYLLRHQNHRTKPECDAHIKDWLKHLTKNNNLRRYTLQKRILDGYSLLKEY